MSSLRSFLFGALLLFSPGAFAQTANTVFGAGYTSPVPINAAPGQVLNLMVAGIGAGLTQRVTAPGTPLPTVLAGISVQLTQTSSPQSVAVPIMAISPMPTCPAGASIGSAPCGRYTVVTVEMPFELVPACQPQLQVCPSATPLAVIAQLVVSENGVAGGAITVNPVADQIHIANLCDLDASSGAGCANTPLIAHADGTLVSAANPATAGEEIVIYALGLGTTKPAVPTGQATPVPAPLTTAGDLLSYNFQLNAPPSKGLPAPLAACAVNSCLQPPVFAGLSPGSVGLYQLNFVVPTADYSFRCGGPIQSNFTVSIIGSTSFDGAGICVSQEVASVWAPARGGSSLLPTHVLDRRIALRNEQRPVRVEIVPGLCAARRPVHFEAIEFLGVPQSEVECH
jgi:uncharacterized protein (TIGR03437 family)